MTRSHGRRVFAHALACLLLACEPAGPGKPAEALDSVPTGEESGPTRVESAADTACDTAGPGAQTWYPDADGDGHGDPAAPLRACAHPPGHVAAGDDCDDGDASIYAGAPDKPQDGIDQDCDGADAPLLDCETNRVTWTGDVEFSGDEAALDMEQFCYACNVVDGSVGITGVGTVEPLACLCEVTGDLVVTESPELASLVGLDQVGTVGGTLRVDHDASLADLAGLGALRRVGGDVNLGGNDVMTSLGGLDQLDEIGEDLIVSTLPSLASLDGLESLTTVGGLVHLVDLGEVVVLDGLPALESIERLTIYGNDKLTRVEAFQALRSVDDRIRMHSNDAQVEFGDFPALESAYVIEVDYGLDSLAELDGFEALTVLAAIYFDDAEALEAITGFNALTELTSDFTIKNCDRLTTVAGFNSLTRLDRVHLEDNPVLADFRGLARAEALADDFHVEQSGAISLSGWEGLETIGGYLAIETNATLPSLGGLDGVREIDGGLYILANPILSDVSALHGIEWVGGDIEIADNPSLADADVEALIEAIGEENVGGTISTYDNGG